MADESKNKKDTSLEDLLAEVEAEFEEAEEKEEDEEIKEIKEQKKIEVKTKKDNSIKKPTKKETNVKKEKTEKKSNTKKEDKSLILNKGELSVNETQLEKIESEMKKQRSIPKEERNVINKKVFLNIILGIITVAFFLFINIGYYTIEANTYLVDLKVFSAIGIGITIILFEKAYKKESARLTVFGIEALVLSILTLITNYLYVDHFDKYPYIVNIFSIISTVYYLLKSIIIYVKMRKEAFKKISDIRNIIKK